LDWRRENQIDGILRESNPHFDTIKAHYPHFCHGQGYNGEPCYYERPPKANLKAMQNAGADLERLLRHYVMVTEFQWQYLVRDDLKRSIYIIDLEGMKFTDFVGDVVDFVKRASALSSQHYPERAGFGTSSHKQHTPKDSSSFHFIRLSHSPFYIMMYIHSLCD
jgi:hypothetical protein